MKKKYKLAVFIGRLQPFHNGHKEIVDQAMKVANSVLILVGSANRPKTFKNPWSFLERKQMIESSLKEYEGRFKIKPLNDNSKDDEWLQSIYSLIDDTLDIHTDVCLVGCEKDVSSNYLKDINLPNEFFAVHANINARNIREDLFERVFFEDTAIPPSVQSYLVDWINSPEFYNLQDEARYYQKYKTGWKDYVIEPFFNTADAVIFDPSGKVLLIERRQAPGKGLLALPGGFVDVRESMLDAAIRELKEETSLELNAFQRRALAKNYKMFDAPFRSSRGRIVTHAYSTIIDFPQHLNAGDDAKRVLIVDYENINMEKMYEDHFDIINHFAQQYF